jgi:uncharacterized protein
MTGNSPSRRLVLGGFAMVAALSACSSSPSPQLYTLAARPAQPVGRFNGTIALKRVAVAKYLDRMQIVRFSSPYEVSASEFNLWAEDLTDMTTRILVESLAKLLSGSQVYSDSTAMTLPPADVTLEVDIDRFEPDAAGTVVLAAQWVAQRKERADPLRSMQITVAPKSADITAQVAAMSDALAQLATRIATGFVAP